MLENTVGGATLVEGNYDVVVDAVDEQITSILQAKAEPKEKIESTR